MGCWDRHPQSNIHRAYGWCLECVIQSGWHHPRQYGGRWRRNDTRVDVATGVLKSTLTGHTGLVRSVSFSPDGMTLASLDGWSDNTVRLWDISTGASTTIFTVGQIGVWSVSFSPDGRTLASGRDNGIVRLWDVATATHTATLTGHTGSVLDVLFGWDGTTVVSVSRDHTMRLWDVSTGAVKSTLSSHTGFIESVSFSPDGLTLASGSFDGTVLLWDLTPEPPRLVADVNSDGSVNIQDLVAVAAAFGETAAGAPAATHFSRLSPKTVQQWLSEAERLNLTDATSRRGIQVLEQLLIALIPTETALLANYPNPFNPETWIPYQLANPADVTLRIYAIDGSLVRTLSLGHKAIGMYQSRSRAAYWDGRNELGEPVASGVYFYTLTAGDFIATRKMLIQK